MLDDFQVATLKSLLKEKIFEDTLLPQGFYLPCFQKTLLSVHLGLMTNKDTKKPQLKRETGIVALEAFVEMVQKWGGMSEMRFDIEEGGTRRADGLVTLVSQEGPGSETMEGGCEVGV